MMSNIRFGAIHTFQFQSARQPQVDGYARQDFKQEMSELADRIGLNYTQRDGRAHANDDGDFLTICTFDTGRSEVDFLNGTLAVIPNEQDEAILRYVDRELPDKVTYQMRVLEEDVPHHLRPFLRG